MHYNDNRIDKPLIEDDEDDNFQPDLSAEWPTPSGVTEAQARDRCEGNLQTSSVYTTCVNETLDTERTDELIYACMMDIKASINSLNSFAYKIIEINHVIDNDHSFSHFLPWLVYGPIMLFAQFYIF